MSKINDRSLQLKMIFNDEDLRKPDHDKIMAMLDAWLRVPENLTGLFKPTFPRRRLWVDHALQPVRLDHPLIEKDGWDKAFKQASLDLKGEHKFQDEDFAGAWPDEPIRPVLLQDLEWEAPMFGGEPGDRRAMPVGFFDLRCRCLVGSRLTKEVTRRYRVSGAKEGEYPWQIDYEFLEMEPQEVWKVEKDTYDMYFEVKTEIRSIGELVRQIQLYRYSGTFNAYNHPRAFVVAPPHEEAEAVCKSQGIWYLRVDKTGLSLAPR